jgi:hypothetical protein
MHNHGNVQQWQRIATRVFIRDLILGTGAIFLDTTASNRFLRRYIDVQYTLVHVKFHVTFHHLSAYSSRFPSLAVNMILRSRKFFTRHHKKFLCTDALPQQPHSPH